MTSKPMISKHIIEQFSHLLVDNLGIYYSKERWPELEKKFIQIMAAFHFQDPEVFIKFLNQKELSKEQITLLAHHITIGETYFFRDPKTFNVLKHNILPTILKRNEKERQIRIWSAGCCTGEEPYSIAILLHELISDWENWTIFIWGTDINSEFLKKAQQGIYKAWSFRTTPPEIIQRYFTQSKNSTYALIPEIKKNVHFAYFNLVENNLSPFLNRLANMDLILCQNVLIYFSRDQLKKVVSLLAKALKEHAWLCVSPIEASFINEKHLISEYFSGTYFFKKESKKENVSEQKHSQSITKEIALESILPIFLQSSSSSAPDFIEKGRLLEKSTASPISDRDAKQGLYEECQSLAHDKRYEEAIAKLLEVFLPHQSNESFIRHHLKEMTLLIQIYANQGKWQQALDWIELALNADNSNPIPYYLKAVVFHFLHDISNAIKSLNRAIWFDPGFVVAHYLMGLLEQERGNEDKAKQSFKKALDLLRRYDSIDILPGTEELSAGHLKNLLLILLEK